MKIINNDDEEAKIKKTEPNLTTGKVADVYVIFPSIKAYCDELQEFVNYTCQILDFASNLRSRHPN